MQLSSSAVDVDKKLPGNQNSIERSSWSFKMEYTSTTIKSNEDGYMLYSEESDDMILLRWTIRIIQYGAKNLQSREMYQLCPKGMSL